VNSEIGFQAFCCKHINFEIVFHSAPIHAIFTQKIGKLSGARPSRLWRSTLGPFQNPKYATAVRNKANCSEKVIFWQIALSGVIDDDVARPAQVAGDDLLEKTVSA